MVGLRDNHRPNHKEYFLHMEEGSYLTAEGAARLRQELEYLKGPARDELAKRLRAAIQQGDLSENADYISAKEEQGFLEGRILELERVLRNVIIIPEENVHTEVVNVGAHITIQEEDYPPETYHLVGPKEADPRHGRISHESPIGRALIGHHTGETVIAETPGGQIQLKIIKIE
jgi:transcription elongation factor GreA